MVNTLLIASKFLVNLPFIMRLYTQSFHIICMIDQINFNRSCIELLIKSCSNSTQNTHKLQDIKSFNEKINILNIYIPVRH